MNLSAQGEKVSYLFWKLSQETPFVENSQAADCVVKEELVNVFRFFPVFERV